MFAMQVRLLARSAPQRGWREIALSLAIMWGLGIWATSELLSVCHQLNVFWIRALWLSALLATILVTVSQYRVVLSDLQGAQIWRVLAFHRVDALFVVVVLLILVCLATVAWVAAPSNWDSQTYHLSRVAHWIQNQSLAFYPTHIPRQLYLGPGAELIVLHAQILTGDDRLANFVQYGAMLGSLVGVSHIARLLGGGSRAQLFGVVAAVTIPMGILQATSTQNDYVTGFWLVCFVAFALEAQEKPTWRLWFLTASSLGLAILTKGTSYVFAAPFVAWIGVSRFKREHLAAVKPALFIAAIVLSINAAHYSRNRAVFGNVLGPPSEGNLILGNELYTPAALLSNVSRNVALHLGVPHFDGLNALTQRIIEDLHTLLRVGIDDLRTTWAGDLRVTYSRHEDVAGAPLHVGLMVAAFALLAVANIRSGKLIRYAACASAGFVLFCWLLKWQPWHARLHLPLLLLISPFCAVMCERALPPQALRATLTVLIIWALPYVFCNQTRPLIGVHTILRTSRVSQYFVEMPQWEAPYRTVATYEYGDCRLIGLILGGDQWEYPLWALTRSAQPPLTLRHVNVQNFSGRLSISHTPCAIIAAPGASVSVNGRTYSQAVDTGLLSVFVARARE